MTVGATVAPGLARLPEPVERAGALLGRHPRPFVADPQLDPVAALRGDDAAPRCPRGATSSALLSRLSTTCSRRPGVADATGVPATDGVDVHVLLGRERVPRVAPAVEHVLDRRSAPDRDVDCSARVSTSRPSTSRDSRDTSASAPSRSSAAAPSHVGLEVLEPQPQRGERRAQLVRRVGDERHAARPRAAPGAPRSR